MLISEIIGIAISLSIAPFGILIPFFIHTGKLRYLALGLIIPTLFIFWLNLPYNQPKYTSEGQAVVMTGDNNQFIVITPSSQKPTYFEQLPYPPHKDVVFNFRVKNKYAGYGRYYDFNKKEECEFYVKDK